MNRFDKEEVDFNFDKHFAKAVKAVERGQKAAILGGVISAVFVGIFAICGATFMGWVIYTLVTK